MPTIAPTQGHKGQASVTPWHTNTKPIHVKQKREMDGEGCPGCPTTALEHP